MAVSKVILNGTTLIDVTQKTVSADNLLLGETALKNDGTDVVGTYQGGGSTTLVHISFGVGVGSFVYYVDSNNEIQQWSTGQPLEDSFEKYCISGSMLVFLCKKQTSIVSSVTNATLVDSVDWSSGTYRCLEVYQVD